MVQTEKRKLKLQTFTNAETVETLSHLFEEALDGKIKGLCFFVKYDTHLHKIGVTGAYRDRPYAASRPLKKLIKELDKLADEREEEAQTEIKF